MDILAIVGLVLGGVLVGGIWVLGFLVVLKVLWMARHAKRLAQVNTKTSLGEHANRDSELQAP